MSNSSDANLEMTNQNGAEPFIDPVITKEFKSTALFSSLDTETLKALSIDAQIRSTAAGEPVFTIGQYDGYEVFIFLEGEAQLTTMSADTGNMRLEAVWENDIVGLEYVLSEAQESTAQMGLTATTDIKYLVVDAQNLQDSVEHSLDVAKLLLKHCAAKMAGQRLEPLPPKQESDSTKRLMAVLFDMIKRDPNDATGWVIEKMPKHRELSEKSGATEQQSAQLIAQLISEGVVRRQYPGLVIDQYDAFQSMAI